MSHWTHLSDRLPVGRKDYQCVLCLETIPKGEKHLFRSGICDGVPRGFRLHIDCEQVTVDNKWDDDSWEHHDVSDFREELAEWREARKAATP